MAVKDLKWVGERSSLGFELKSNKKKKWERREDCRVLNHFKIADEITIDFFLIPSLFSSKITDKIYSSHFISIKPQRNIFLLVFLLFFCNFLVVSLLWDKSHS